MRPPNERSDADLLLALEGFARGWSDQEIADLLIARESYTLKTLDADANSWRSTGSTESTSRWSITRAYVRRIARINALIQQRLEAQALAIAVPVLPVKILRDVETGTEAMRAEEGE